MLSPTWKTTSCPSCNPRTFSPQYKKWVLLMILLPNSEWLRTLVCSRRRSSLLGRMNRLQRQDFPAPWPESPAKVEEVRPQTATLMVLLADRPAMHLIHRTEEERLTIYRSRAECRKASCLTLQIRPARRPSLVVNTHACTLYLQRILDKQSPYFNRQHPQNHTLIAEIDTPHPGGPQFSTAPQFFYKGAYASTN